ncbi:MULTISPECIES: CapA family protein [Clostridium]|uniref:Capsule biosynthesis protein CapA n=1 Tax=Clostridium beijerinckii TaxID=1520 RepID=A0A1S9N2C5_CLOBE|nr:MULTISPECIES: CapA family protein [Clostridium]MBN7574939.1 CapA family protein [Clostridium beijerinckii]MBN7580228.1 CapA family protein [Clostridium beijerinckii]MBN7584703.1 CapA family protein [Clostridium beijerinckii]MBO0521629.1 CapA family protein [Clostridium beijerinckii]MZK50184.1 CapA family protein [Clostridium beijerinckii]
MNDKNSRISHGETYIRDRKKKSNYLKYITFILVAILVLTSSLIYLKYGKGLSDKKNTANDKVNGETDKSIDDDKYKTNKLKEPIKKTIVISFAGDFTLGTDTKFPYDGSLPAAFIGSGKNYSYFMQNVSSVFSKDDYTLVNLETTFTDSKDKAHKDGEVFYNFKGPKEYVNILTSGSIEGVTIANNHIYDYGKQGINDTINTLKEKNIDICGEGYKILKDIQGIKFGFLGYTGWEYSNNLKSKIIGDISELRKQGAEVVIPYFHWGVERKYEPDNVQKSLARFSIDNGADAVIGSHPHVIESMENYKGKFIAYSMGNFCFGGNSNPSDKRTFILQIKVNTEDDKLSSLEYKVIPAMISSRDDKNDYIPTLAGGENRTEILRKLNELSPTLNGNIKDEFFKIK